MPVQYLGGLTVWPRRPSSSDAYALEGTDEVLRILFLQPHVIKQPTWVPAVDVRWTSLRALDVSSTNTTRANVGAIALFGVLGLAARRAAGTYISLTTDGMDALFLSDDPVAQVRPKVERLVPDPYRHLLRLDGRPVHSGAPTDAAHRSPSERLARVAALHAEGLITDDELADRRAAILAEL